MKFESLDSIEKFTDSSIDQSFLTDDDEINLDCYFIQKSKYNLGQISVEVYTIKSISAILIITQTSLL